MNELTVTNLISSTINLPGSTKVAVKENGVITTDNVSIKYMDNKILISKDSKFPVLEMFCSIQGEGKWTGVPSIFIRVAGCNLRCVFGNSRCDTPYSSFELEKPKWNTVQEAADVFVNLIKNNPFVKHIVITGGEPLLYKNQIKEFLELIAAGDYGYITTIETNGTLPAIDPWEDEEGFVNWIDLWSISPKLSTSVDYNCKFLTETQRDNHNKIRINIDNLTSYVEAAIVAKRWCKDNGMSIEDELPNFQLKFVYSGPESVIEIKEILFKITDELLQKHLVNEIFDLSNHVMLMPEGTTNEQLSKISRECAEVCIREGWRFCDRLHIRIWGDKRGV